MTPKHEIVYPDFEPPKLVKISSKIGILFIVVGICLIVDSHLPNKIFFIVKNIIMFIVSIPTPLLLIILGIWLILPHLIYFMRGD